MTLFGKSGSHPLSQILLACTGLAVAWSAAAQVPVSEPGLEPVETAPVDIAAAAAADWGIRETDWQRYRELLRGPAGLHYRHLSPAFVLGLHAETDAERDRWAQVVYEEERRRLDRLFDFNRAYNRIARAERSREVRVFRLPGRQRNLAFLSVVCRALNSWGLESRCRRDLLAKATVDYVILMVLFRSVSTREVSRCLVDSLCWTCVNMPMCFG